MLDTETDNCGILSMTLKASTLYCDYHHMSRLKVVRDNALMLIRGKLASRAELAWF